MGDVVGTVDMGGKQRGNQLDVVCPTTACVAGWACHLSGDQMLVPQRGLRYSVGDGNDWEAWLRVTYPDDDGPAQATCVRTRDKKWVKIADRAADVLDLDEDERCWLFADNRTREEVLHALDLLGKGDRVGFKLYADVPLDAVSQP